MERIQHMDATTARAMAEGLQETDSEEQYYAAWQHLIDTGEAWMAPGSIGREAAALIARGLCHQRRDV